MNEKTNRAIDMSRYIVNKCHSENYLISNLKLQKLLYYAQGFSLALIDKPLFDDDIEAWDFGPVVPSVYREYKVFGASEIPMIQSYFDYNFDSNTFLEEISFSNDIFNDYQTTIMDFIVNNYAKFSANALVTLTHKHIPWKESYDRNKSVISKESIKKYFKDNIK